MREEEWEGWKKRMGRKRKRGEKNVKENGGMMRDCERRERENGMDTRREWEDRERMKNGGKRRENDEKRNGR